MSCTSKQRGDATKTCSIDHPPPLYLIVVGGWQYKKKQPGDGVVMVRLVTPASAAGDAKDERFKYLPVVVIVGDKVAQEDEEPSSTSSLGEILILVLPLLLIYISNSMVQIIHFALVDFSLPTMDATTLSTVSAFEARNIVLHLTQSQYGLLESTVFTLTPRGNAGGLIRQEDSHIGPGVGMGVGDAMYRPVAIVR
ncbi:hypothetical protein ACHAW5_010301 [Stephanodiscus triporus]|uniref:Uncharacterized protein n=1 Tax=Stephanodiscus triporus TaxID=2934178 RepID=A0ABD3N989_9STRA